MPNFLQNIFILATISMVVTGTIGCGVGSSDDEVLVLEEAPAANADIVSAHTEGVISQREEIRVRFTSAVAVDSMLGNEVASPFHFQPAIKGKAVWKSTREITFQPDEYLVQGTEYRANVDLGVLQESWTGQTFGFEFTAEQQSYRPDLVGLESFSADGSVQQFKGTLITADVAEEANVEQVLSAKYAGEAAEIVWTHSGDGLNHYFTVKNLARGDDTTRLILDFDGDAIDVDQQLRKTIEVPSLDQFEAASARPVSEGQQFIELRFTDPLDEKQDLNGLVTVSNHPDVRFDIRGSVLKIFSNASFNETLTVEIEGITNAAGRKLPNSQSLQVSFTPIKPAVRFAGKGVIFPTTETLTVPIEVANLQAVEVEAYRVYDTNIPQFLQVNSLEGDEQLNRVGERIWKQRVEIEQSKDRTNRWVRLGLDLSDLVAEHPTGLYRLELSFTRHDVVWDCASEPPPRVAVDSPSLEIDWETGNAESSYWDFWGGDMPYWEARDHREDPCHVGYYRKFYDHDLVQSRNVMISDVGIIAKQGLDGEIITVVTDLRTAEPIEGAVVSVLDYQLQEISGDSTNVDGELRLTADHKPFVVKAESDGHLGFLKLDRGSSLSVSHFDVSGASVQKGLKGFMYAERGVWRPGDDIFLSFILQDDTSKLPTDHPVHFELRNPQGQLVEQRVITDGVNGFYDLETRTASDAMTGNYMAKVRVGGASFQKLLRVETVVPNRLKLNVNFGTELIKGPDARLDSTLSAEWLHGAIAKNMDASIEVSLSSKKTTFAKYADFVFDDPTRSVDDDVRELFEGRLNDKGEVQVDEAIPTPSDAPGMLNAKFITRVFEPGGASSSDEVSIAVSPHERYVGIKTPKGDKARDMLLTNVKHPVEIVTVDADGNPTGDGQVDLKLYKINWRWWWDKGNDNLASYAGSSSHQSVAEGSIQMKNGVGKWEFEVEYPEWGRYLLVASDKDGTHRVAKVTYIDWPGWAGRGQKDNPGGASVLSVTTDHNKVEVGDEITLNIPTAMGGRALVSLETGTKVLDMDWVEATGETTQYRFTATADMAPSVFANVTLMQPHSNTSNDLPLRLYGITPIEVVDPGTKLQPKIATAAVFEPQTTASIAISEVSGQAMTYTLAVVDQGLLGLTRFKTPDPWTEFFRREALGVRTWDLYDLVAGTYEGSLEGLLAIGGDGSDGAPPNAKANRFVPMVRVLGPFELAAGEPASPNIDIPPYIGEVREMLVAGQNGAFGKAEKAVKVKKPLMLLATLPRVLGPQETLSLPVNVFALEDNIKNVTVTATVKGPIEIPGDQSKKITFSDPGDQLVNFDLEVADALGIAVVTVVAEGGGQRAEQTIEIDIRHPGSRVTDVVGEVVEDGKDWSQLVNLVGLEGTNEVTLEVSRVPPLDLSNQIDRLIRYPHGCVEQTTSSVFPQLYLATLMDLPPTQQDEIQNNVQAGIKRLRSFQTSNGGMAYWPGQRDTNAWGTNYAGNFLIEAERAGFLLPSGMRSNWVSFQKRKANQWSSSTAHSDLEQAYRLYTLALAGEAELGAMNRLKAGNLSVAAKWRLAAAYQLAGQDKVAADLIEKVTVSVKRYAELNGTFGSDIRDEAMIL
ncbi:MAG: hypothetical protein GWP91_07795 [Rhodobacterales bacterium]|nr:hypothetical protein [Rhodobacterales bacterium]